MSRLSLFTGVIAAAYSVASFALSPPAPTHYSKQSIEILNVASHCPTELGELAKYGQISEAVSQVGSDGTQFSILFLSPAYMPSTQRTRVGELRILTQFVKSNINHPDAPGGIYTYECRAIK
jgi:hypothetical protein